MRSAYLGSCHPGPDNLFFCHKSMCVICGWHTSMRCICVHKWVCCCSAKQNSSTKRRQQIWTWFVRYLKYANILVITAIFYIQYTSEIPMHTNKPPHWDVSRNLEKDTILPLWRICMYDVLWHQVDDLLW